MRLVLENIGMLKNAEINLKNLSVIAGENDNGKSTIGKVVFCIIKAMSRYKEDFQESKEFRVNKLLESAFFSLRSELLDFDNQDSELFTLINAIHDEESSVEERLSYFKYLIDDFHFKSNVSKDFLEKTQEEYATAISLIDEPEDINGSIESALKKVFYAEFDSNILLSGAKEGSIKLFEKKLKLIDIKVLINDEIVLLNEVNPIELKDATFIETPLIINNHDLLIRSKSGLSIGNISNRQLGVPYTTLHTKDLFDKLIEPSYGNLFKIDTPKEKSLKQTIQNSIEGKIVYDTKKRDFVFKKQDKDISIKNTASGIKVFGILQLLSGNGFINASSILIFDEPENHLHPMWQLKLAEILANLAKSGVYILVSSHSPYMIEALKRYSDKVELEKKTSFYLAENRTIENHSKLEEIFIKLAEPFDVFRKMDAEFLRDE